MGLISVITPTRDRAASYLVPMVESVARVVLPEEIGLEHILVNDGSVDETEKVLGELSERFAHVRVFSSGTCSVGVGAARNLGLQAAKGEWVADIDDDDLATTYGLGLLYQQLTANPSFSWIHGEAFVVNEKTQLLAEILRGGREGMSDDEWITEVYEGKVHAMSGTKLYKRSALNEIGGWDEDLRVAEDLDLWFRLGLSCGAPLYCSEVPVLFYRKKVKSLGIDALNSGEMMETVKRVCQRYQREYQEAVERLAQKPKSGGR